MKSTTLYTFLTKIIALFLLVIISFSLTGCNKEHIHPSDEKMIFDFQTDQMDYDRLIVMLRADKALNSINKINTSGTNNEISFFPKDFVMSVERRNEYLSIMTKLKAKRIFTTWTNEKDNELKEVEILVSVSEFKYNFDEFHTKSEKSYVWMNPIICPEEKINPHQKIVSLDPGEKEVFVAPCNLTYPSSFYLSDNLDKYNKFHSVGGFYRKIRDNWYLHLYTSSNENSGE